MQVYFYVLFSACVGNKVPFFCFLNWYGAIKLSLILTYKVKYSNNYFY